MFVDTWLLGENIQLKAMFRAVLPDDSGMRSKELPSPISGKRRKVLVRDFSYIFPNGFERFPSGFRIFKSSPFDFDLPLCASFAEIGE